MQCYHPVTAFKSINPKPNGKFHIIFNGGSKDAGERIKLGCGRCIGCRLDRSQMWALRCTHEASLHDNNCFVTLTYRDEDLPHDKSLYKEHFQNFMKRLRKYISPLKVRYYACGEYGVDRDLTTLNQLGRPHYHACLFGYDFPDKELFSNGDYKIYTSEILEKIWGKGFCTIGDLTYETAAYTARYVTKKINGDLAFDHYQRFDEETGEIQLLLPEFSLQSTKPGIGGDFFHLYKSDFNKDYVTHNGVKHKSPKYYDKLFEKFDADEFGAIKEKRKAAIDDDDPENSPERLSVKERLTKSRLEKLKRTIK